MVTKVLRSAEKFSDPFPLFALPLPPLQYTRKQGTQIGTNRKRTGKSEQSGTNRGDPFLVTPMGF